MDFKIGDDFDENGNVKEHKFNKKLAIIIVVVCSIIIGLTVFFISYAILGGNKKDDDINVDKQLAITDENVQILYKYVSYRDNGYGNDLFLKENSVTSSTFTDQDKLYYALQFLQPEELIYSGEKNDKKQKIYNLSISKIRGYLQSFFGTDVAFSPINKFTYKFTFTINDLGVATLTYSEEEQVYKVVFAKEEEDTNEELVKPYYTELTSATKKADGTILINEKVIYTTSSKDNTNYIVNVYKDYQHTTLIEARQNITEDDLKENPLSIDKYLERAATITYTFKVSSLNNNYYFDNSKIEY